MRLSLNAPQAQLICADLMSRLREGHARDFVLDRRVKLGDIDLEDVSPEDETLDRHLWSESLSIRKRLLDDGAVQAYKGDDSDPFRFALEELMASELYLLLNDLPDEYLHDAGFWRYLALYPFRWFLIEREWTEGSEFRLADYGGTSGGREKWLMVRCFQWGKRCYQPGDSAPFPDAVAVRATRRHFGPVSGRIIDFYHSHIVRSRWADLPKTSHAFIQITATKPYVVDTGDGEGRLVNELAKRVTRIVGNLCLPALPNDTLVETMNAQKAIVLGMNEGQGSAKSGEVA